MFNCGHRVSAVWRHLVALDLCVLAQHLAGLHVLLDALCRVNTELRAADKLNTGRCAGWLLEPAGGAGRFLFVAGLRAVAGVATAVFALSQLALRPGTSWQIQFAGRHGC